MNVGGGEVGITERRAGKKQRTRGELKLVHERKGKCNSTRVGLLGCR